MAKADDTLPVLGARIQAAGLRILSVALQPALME